MFRVLLLSIGMILVLNACAAPVEADPSAPQVNPVESGSEATPPPNPYQPLESDAALQRGEVFLDTTDLLVIETYPKTSIGLALQGNLPTPCHQLRIASRTEAENRILVEVYSVVDPTQICVQMLQPFEVTYNLGSFPSGNYTVWVNGKQIGQFDS